MLLSLVKEASPLFKLNSVAIGLMIETDCAIAHMSLIQPVSLIPYSDVLSFDHRIGSATIEKHE